MLFNANNQKGVFPILLILILFIALAGFGVGLFEMTSSGSEKDLGQRMKQFFDAKFKKNFDYSNTPEKKDEFVTSEEADNAAKKRTGELI